MSNESTTQRKVIPYARVAVLLMACALLTVTVASAQVTVPIKFMMDTPFIVENTTLPAGTYEVAPTNDPSLLELHGVDGPPRVLFEVVPIDTLTRFKETELVFNKYGNNLVLKSIRPEGEASGATTLTSHAERRNAMTSGKPTQVSRSGELRS